MLILMVDPGDSPMTGERDIFVFGFIPSRQYCISDLTLVVLRAVPTYAGDYEEETQEHAIHQISLSHGANLSTNNRQIKRSDQMGEEGMVKEECARRSPL